MKTFQRPHPLWLTALILLLTLTAWTTRGPQTTSGLETAWTRAQKAGAYTFTADIVQQSIPVASIANVGRTSKESALHLEGDTNLATNDLHFTLWSQGGNVLDSTSGYEVKVENGQTYARQETQPWQEMDSFSDSFAPAGDFLGFLTAAENVTDAGEETRTLPDGSTLTFHRYTYQINGPRFAAYMRDKMETTLRGRGELLPGMELDASALLKDLKGTGELWVDADGLPLRQITHLTFPPENDAWIETDITVQFTNFERLPLALPLTRTLTQTGLLLAGAILALALFRRLPFKTLHIALVTLVIASMLLTPLLESARAASMNEQRLSKQTPQPTDSPTNLPTNTDPNQLTTLRADTGLDTDADGATDVQETFLGTNPFLADDPLTNQQTNQLSDQSTDSDADGLTDYEETLLGTDLYNLDSDGDLIPDLEELQGFTHNGQHFSTDPLLLDTNNDSLSDYREWNDPETFHPTWDTDNDGLPDLFDEDNDGDGVPDRLDVSPFENRETVYSRTNPFNLNIQGLTPGETTFVEFQLRPTDPDHLWYTLDTLDWPLDDKGNITDKTGGTFPGRDGDIQLVPMLELQITGTPSNLPLTAPVTEVTLRPFPNATNPVTATHTLETVGNDLAFTFDPTNINNVYVRTGTCADPGTVAYGPITLPSNGLTRIIPGVTLEDWANGNYILTTTLFDNRNIQSCGSIRHLPFENGQIVDLAALEPFQLTVRDITADHSTKVVYIPLNLITDPDTGARVAFNGQMVYLPASVWAQPHQVRLVWAVNMLTDDVCQIGSINPADPEKCLQSADDVPNIIHVYDDTFTLTGVDVREDHRVDLALVYEDPTVDANLHDDLALTMLADGLDYAFLSGRDCDIVDADVCAGDGQRDFSIPLIAQRFDRDLNNDVPEEEKWDIEDTLQVETRSYETMNAMLQAVTEDEINPLLASFTPAWTPTAPITPTVLFAYEYEFRAANLDSSDVDQSMQWNPTGDTLAVNLTTNSAASTVVGLKMSPYGYDGQDWSQMEAGDYWNLLEKRYTPEFADEADTDAAEGQVVAVQLYLFTLFQGFQRTVQVGNVILDSASLPDSLVYARMARSAASGAGKFITTQIYIGRALAMSEGSIRSLWLYLKLGFKNFFKNLTVAGPARLSKFLFSKFRAVQSLRAKGSILLIVIGALAALTTFIVFAVLRGTGNGSITLNRAIYAVAATVMLILGVVLPLMDGITSITAAHSGTKAFVHGKHIASARTLTKGAKFAALIGLVLEVGIIWGYFIYAVASGEVQLGTAEFSYLVSFSMAATAVAVLFALIAVIPVVGLAIVGLVAFFDLLMTLICEFGVDVDGDPTQCFGITTWLTDNLTEVLYGADVIFNFEDTTYGETLDLTSLDVEFVDPNKGVVEGNSIRFVATLDMNLHPSEPDMYVPQFYKQDNIKTTGLDFSLDAQSVNHDATRNNAPDGWSFVFVKSIHRTTVGIVYSISGEFPLYVGRPPAMTLQSDPIPLTVGVNTLPPLYLNGSLSIPKWSCSGEFCNSGGYEVDINESLNDDAIFFDVLPATLDEFYAMNWDAALPVQLDQDGDGVLALSDGGLDPNDSTWDSDGDGLSDAFELDYQQKGLDNGGGAVSLQNLDSDNDGLCDVQEIAIGSRPDTADSDLDGLADADEFFHQDLCNADGDNDTTEYVGGWLFTYADGASVRISSNPISPDDDADGMSDLTEKTLHELDPVTYPFHPNVFNISPVGLDLQTSDLDRVVLPGATFLYTATVQNNLTNPLYADGTLNVTFPVALGGGTASHPFSVFQGETAPFPTTLTSSGGSQIVSIENDLSATIEPSGQLSVPVPLAIDFTENLLVTIDNDNPTSSLTSGDYVRAGGFRVIGGTANDPTSYIKGVDISFDSGAVFTPTTGAEAWAFTWNVPTLEGRYDLLTRAADAVGHFETPPNAITVIVDGQPPALTSDISGNPILRSYLNTDGHWTLALSGSAVDPFIGPDPGSGTVLVEVLVEPLSNFWQTAVLNGSDWTIDYALSNFDADNGNLPVIDPTGQYTVTVRATDLVGNMTPDDALVTFPVRVDNRAPVTALDPINTQITVISPTLSYLTATTFISTSLTLTGIITDSGQVAAGVNELQLSFTPAELLDSLTTPALLMYLNDPDGSTTFRDASGNNISATCAGNACPTGDAPGIYGGALQFNGSNDFVDVAANLPETDYTLSVWFNTPCTNCGLLQADAGNLGSAGHDRDLFLSGGNVCLFVDGTINDTFCSSGTNYADGQWHQAVHAMGTSGSVLYVDGLPAATGIVTASDFNQTGMNLGFASEAGTDFLNGHLDELAVYPGVFSADQVFSLYRNWQTVNLSQSGAGVANTSWDYTIPDGLEGYYQLDLRGADVLGNRNDEHRSAYTHWQGLVDTAPPDVNMLVTYSGVGQSALTTYSGFAEDFDLVTDGYAFPCALQPDEQQMYDSAWWDAISNNTPRLYQFTPSCSLTGFHTDNVFLRACDAFGRCTAATPDTYKLYFATQTGWFGDNYQIERANLFDGTAREVILDGLDHVMGLDVDIPRGHLYWLEADRALGDTTPVSGRIRRANLDGTNILDVLTGLTFPVYLNPRSGGFALNAAGGKLYWSTGNQVWWANLDGTGAEVLFTIPGPQDTVGEIALDLTHAKLYWMADESGTPLEDQQIWQANLDGTGAVVLLDNLDYIVDVTVDAATSQLYWMEQDDLWRAHLDGTGIEQLNVSVSASVVNGSFAIGPVGNLAFLSNQGHIRQINLNNQQAGTLIPSINFQLAGPVAIARIPGQTFTQPDLVLENTATSGLGVQGDTLTYQFVVRNVGLLDAANVVLTDTLPTGLGFASASVGCDAAGQTVTCSLGNIASGGVFTATLTANVSGSASGTLVNTASIAADNGDLSPANNTVTVSDAVAVPAATATPASPANGRYIYWSNFFEIRRIRLDVPGSDSLVIALDPADGFVEGITVDNVNNQLYWTRPSAGLIQRANLDGTGLETFVTGAGEPRDVTVDPVGGFLYWSDVDGQVIERIALNGTGRTVIVPDALDVKDLIVDTLRGFLYWGDATGQLWRANLDGSNAEALLSDVWVFNLALDPYAEKVYWINPIKQTLQRIAPDGSGLENIALPLSTPSEGLVVDAAAAKLYWAEGDSLFRANLDGSGSETVATGLNGISSGGLGETLVQVYETVPAATFTPSPTVTPSPTITPTPLPPTLTPTPTTTPQPLPTSTPGGPPAADNIFWGVFGTLQSAPTTGCNDGSCVANLANTVFTASSLAVDSVHHKIYWLEGDGYSEIKRADLDGSNVESVFFTNDLIDQFTLDSEGGFLYWTSSDFSSGTGILVRATLDGTNPTTLISGLDAPTFLALDRPRNKIYWFDELNYPEKRLFRANLGDGSNVEMLVFEDGTNNPPLIGSFLTGLAIDEAHAWLYWTEQDTLNATGRVRRADLSCTPIADCLRTMVEDPNMAPYGIALDLTSLIMYWPGTLGSSPNYSYVIQSTLLDGTGTVNTVVAGLTDEPRHIALYFPPIPPTPTPTLPPTLTPTTTPACVVSPDAFEPDDAFAAATEIGLESGPSVNHNFHTVSDQDWLFFDAQIGFFYTIYTRIQDPDADTVLELYDTDGTTLLASNDNTGSLPHSQLTFDPPANGRYYLRVTNVSGLATCLTSYNVHLDSTAPTPIPPKGPNPPGHGDPVLDSAVQTPADDALIASTDTLNVEVGAFALDFLQTITLTVDGNVIGITTFPQDTITETTWTTPWTPGAEGEFTLVSVASDWAGRVQTDTHPIRVVVDTGLPAVSLSPTVYTSTHLIGTNQIALTGSASDGLGIAQVYVNVNGGGMQIANVNGGGWSLPWLVGAMDGLTVPVTVLATDPGGQSAQMTESVTVDVAPPQPGVPNTDGIALTHNGEPITPTQTIYEANPSLAITWQPFTDGGGVAGYYAGWTTDITPTLSALTFYPPNATLQHIQTVGEAEVRYAHLIALDVYGNRTTFTAGPFYVDGPTTPDLVDDFGYHGWQFSGATQLGADKDITKGPFGASALGVVQNFYASWDADTLRMSWVGADWNTDGDLFIYLDTASGGATDLFNPYTPPATIGLPASMTANFLIWIEDDQTAGLYAASGNDWALVTALTSDEFRFQSGVSPLVADLRLPFSLLGLTSGDPVSLVAVASEEDTLTLWAAAPDKNPLNSPRVINALAAGRDLSSYTLTLSAEWGGLGAGIAPNAGQFADTDLQITIASNPAGVGIGFLSSDLLDLLASNVRLDADLDGQIDLPLPIPLDQTPVGDGQTISYVIRYTNAGPATAENVVVSLEDFGAISLSNSVVTIGDIGPGESGEVTVTGTVNAGNGVSGEVRATISDAGHGDHDWAWIQHDLDNAAPTGVVILDPLDYARPFTQTVSGLAADPSGIAFVTLEFQSLTTGPATTITCPDPTPFDGTWACAWNPGDLTGLSGMQIRVSATDLFGNESAFTDFLTLAVDDTAPTLTVDPSFDAALADGLFTPDEALIFGQVVDDQQAAAFEVCLTEGSIPTPVCNRANVAPGDAPTGDWVVNLLLDGDGTTFTLRLYGIDGAGNRSAPFQRTFEVDMVPPALTATLLHPTVILPDQNGEPLLTGSVSDGGDVDAVLVRMTHPDGSVTFTTVATAAGNWTFAPEFALTGTYILNVEAWDAAGNAVGKGPFKVQVVGVTDYRMYLPIVTYYTPGP